MLLLFYSVQSIINFYIPKTPSNVETKIFNCSLSRELLETAAFETILKSENLVNLQPMHIQ